LCSHTYYLLDRRQRQEKHKFISSLGNIARSCLKKKKKNPLRPSGSPQRGRVSFILRGDGRQRRSQIPALEKSSGHRAQVSEPSGKTRVREARAKAAILSKGGH
jgi:hypothetical protein